MDEKTIQAMLKIAYEAGRAMALEEWEKEAQGGTIPAPPIQTQRPTGDPTKYRKPVERPIPPSLSRGRMPGAPATGAQFQRPGPRMAARLTRQQRIQAGKKY
jgi:hypothetical protein